LSTDRERYGVGSALIVSGLLRDERYRPIADQSISLRILHVSDSETEGSAGDAEVSGATARTDREGQVRATLQGPEESGSYEVVASFEGETLAREVILVEESGDELAEVEIRVDQLQAAANRTGGNVYLGIDDVPPLAELAATSRKASGLISKQPLLSPWFIFLTLGLLAATWVLRRRWGRR
ncbi:MAG: hypothetical protein WBG86_12385, partial [Polyangiales bacterium]